MLAFTDKIIEPLATGVSNVTGISQGKVKQALEMEERNFLSVAAIDMLNVRNNRIPADSMIEEALMKGTILYVANAGIDTFVYGRKLNWDPFNIADQVAFNAVGLSALEWLDVDRFMPQSNSKLYSYLVSSSFITGMEVVGNEFYNIPQLRPLKMIGSTIGKMFNWL